MDEAFGHWQGGAKLVCLNFFLIAHPHQALTFGSHYLRRAHMTVRETGLAGLITFHTHPLADTDVDFSRYDNQEDPLLIENLIDLWPVTWLSSVVLGVGDRLQYLPLDGRPPQPAPAPSEIFDRAKAITGRGALAQLGTPAH